MYLKGNDAIPTSQYNEKKFNNSNCYGFALDVPTPDIFKKLYKRVRIDDLLINPGFASFQMFKFTRTGILENIFADFDSLGIKYFESTIDTPNMHNGYKIAILFRGKSYQGHFIRQNSDGTWSEKVGYSNLIRNFNNIDESYYIKLGYTLDKVYEIVKPFNIENVRTLNK